MIQKIDNVENIKIMPFNITLHEGDTLVVEFDQEEWDIEEAQRYLNMLIKTYPKNGFLATFKGIEIKGVLKNE